MKKVLFSIGQGNFTGAVLSNGNVVMSAQGLLGVLGHSNYGQLNSVGSTLPVMTTGIEPVGVEKVGDQVIVSFEGLKKTLENLEYLGSYKVQ